MKKKWITSIKILLSAFVLWFLVHTSKLNFSLLLNLFNSPSLLLLTIALYLIVVGINTWRWYQLNTAQKLPLSFSQTLLPTYLGIAFNNLLPGGVGGDFFRCYFLFKQAPNQRSGGMLSILFDRLTGLMGIFIIVCIVASLHFSLLGPQKTTFYFLIFCATLCIGTISLYLVSAVLPKKIGITTWLTHHFSERKWLSPVLSVIEAVRVYRNSKIIIAKCLAASVVVQLFISFTCIFLAKMMGFPSLSLSSYIIAISVTQIVNLIPITPGGFGIGEAAFANILSALNPGIGATYATIFLAYRILGIAVYLPGLAVFIFDNQLLQQSKLAKANSN